MSQPVSEQPLQVPEKKRKRWEEEFEEDLAEKEPHEDLEIPDESELQLTPEEKEKFKQYLKFLLSKICAKKSERKRLFRAMMLPKKELRKVAPMRPKVETPIVTEAQEEALVPQRPMRPGRRGRMAREGPRFGRRFIPEDQYDYGYDVQYPQGYYDYYYGPW